MAVPLYVGGNFTTFSGRETGPEKRKGRVNEILEARVLTKAPGEWNIFAGAGSLTMTPGEPGTPGGVPDDGM